MSFLIRLATPADAAVLADLAALTFGLACPPHTTAEAKAAFIAEVLSAERFDGYLTDPEREILLARSDVGAALGYTMIVHAEPTDPDVVGSIGIRPTAELSKCYVLPDHHRSGLAAALMTESIECGRRRGAAGMWLGVNEENERAKRFYAKHGFAHVGSKRFLVGGRLEDDWVMERAI